MKKLNLLFALVLMTASVFAQANVTFQADMTLEIGQHRFVPGSQSIYVTGDFTGWSTTPGTALELTDGDGDKIYTGLYAVDQATYPTINYKFIYTKADGSTQWEDKIGNRTTDISAGGNIEVPVAVFDNMTYAGGNASITFNCDMTVPVGNGSFDPATQKVWIAGNFTDWGTHALELTAGADNVYTGTTAVDFNGANLVGGYDLAYKFIYGDDGFTNLTWENDPNKTYLLADGENTFTRYFNDISPNANLADGNMLFQVDMSVMTDIGIFDPAVDVMEVRGAFNSWSGGENAAMTQDFLDADKWQRNHPFEQIEVLSDQSFKYFVLLQDPGIWTDGWERPLSQGGGNRDVPFEGINDQVVPYVYYDDVHPDFAIPNGTDVSITFNVDMTNATDPGQVAIPFDPAADMLYWICEIPSFARTQGWTDTNEMMVLQLTDPDGDLVFSGTLAIQSPSFNGFLYRYGFVDATDGAWIFEPEGFSDFAYRRRFVQMTGPNAFVQPYSAPNDSWLPQEDKSSQSEDWPLTSVEPIDVIANSFALEQNYPNPFNPETMIRFSIPKAEFVSIKIYNMLGQEVTTLLSKEMATGTYEVSFNAKNLASGVYFYNIKAGDFSASKKMMLLK